jgi:uncharacterized membrane protein YbjE (DUF340 family)
MLNYLICLILGLISGYYIKNDFIFKLKKIMMPTSVLILLFFMGVGIGKDDHLSEKILSFGINAFVISVFSIIFSILFVYLFVRVLKKFI